MDSIKTYLNSLGRATRTVILALAVVFVSAGIAQAATTISTSILTNGTLGATGVSTFGGTASTTISVAGVLTTPSGAVALFLGGASTTQFTLLSGDTIKNATASTTNISGTLTPDALTLTGVTSLASTTATTFKVGNGGTQMSQIVSGFCVTGSTSFSTASTTGVFANCTPFTSAGVAVNNLSVASSRVLVMATSSLPAWIVIQAASTTATNIINVRMVNVSTTTTVAADVYTFNFWAFQ